MSQKPTFLIQLASSAKVRDFWVYIVAKAISHSMMQKRYLLSGFATGTLAALQLFALMWVQPRCNRSVERSRYAESLSDEREQ
jgi:hypothetical protein